MREKAARFLNILSAYSDKLAGRILLIPASAGIVSAYVSFYRPEPLWTLTVLLPVLFWSFFCIRRKKDVRKIVFIAALSAVLILRGGLTISLRLGSDSKEHYLSEETVRITEVQHKLDGNFDITAKTGDGIYIKLLPAHVPEDIGTGDLFLVSGRLTEPLPAGNPGEFDYRRYLRSRGILYCLKPDGFVRTEESRDLLNDFFYRIRKGLADSVGGSDEKLRSYTAAVCLGDSSLLPQDSKDSFRNAGMSHLLAVSGMHFASFLMIPMFICRSLNCRKRTRASVLTAAAFLTALITGFKASVTRAFFMYSCSAWERDGINACAAASAVIILADPFIVLSSGFKMSFAVCLSIVLFADRISEILSRKISETLSDIIAVLLAARLGMLPFVSEASVRISPGNLLFLPVSSFLCGCACIFFVFAALLCPLFGSGFSLPLKLVFDALEFTAATAADTGYGALNPDLLPKIAVYSAVLMPLSLLLPGSVIRKVLLKGASLITALAVGTVFYSFVFPPEAVVRFIDVGQGDCALIESEGKYMMIDGGVKEEGRDTLIPLLYYYGIDHIDTAVMSHWDSDHAAGLFVLKEQGIIDKIYTPDTGPNDKVLSFLESNCSVGPEEAEAYMERNMLKMKAGDKLVMGNVAVSCIAPDVLGEDTNENSLVLLLEAGGTRILFTGDIDQEIENKLASEGLLCDIDLLKVAHHGSRYSTGDEFLRLTKPEAAVISVGRYNKYGHPAPRVLESLKDAGAAVYKTSTGGMITVTIERQAYYIREFTAG